MAIERRFLIAASLARLIERECATATRIVEGHFPTHPERTQLVRVERDQASLILTTRDEDGQPQEEHAQVPRAHAEALLDVAVGTIAFDRIPVPLGGEHHALLDRFIMPGGVNLLTVAESEVSRFGALDWFGPEVTDRPEFEHSALACSGAPSSRGVAVSNAALNALLDTLDAGPAQELGSVPARAEAEASVTPSPEPDATPGRDDHASEHARPAHRTPVLRGRIVELDESIARLARSLAPHESRDATPLN